MSCVIRHLCAGFHHHLHKTAPSSLQLQFGPRNGPSKSQQPPFLTQILRLISSLGRSYPGYPPWDTSQFGTIIRAVFIAHRGSATRKPVVADERTGAPVAGGTVSRARPIEHPCPPMPYLAHMVGRPGALLRYADITACLIFQYQRLPDNHLLGIKMSLLEQLKALIAKQRADAGFVKLGSHKELFKSMARATGLPPQALYLRDLHAAVLEFPMVDRYFHHAVAAGKRRHRGIGLMLLQDRNNLLFAVTLAPHMATSSRSTYQEIPHPAWIGLRGYGQKKAISHTDSLRKPMTRRIRPMKLNAVVICNVLR